MNLRHAAALSLLGWYLMAPSANWKSPTYDMALNKWEIIRSFDTADSCTAYMYQMRKDRWAALAKYHIHTDDEAIAVLGNRDKSLSASDVNAIMTSLADLTSQCIASDDPRLKGK